MFDINGVQVLYEEVIDTYKYVYDCPALPEHFKFAPRTKYGCNFMFSGNYKITNIDSFDTSKAVGCSGMFAGCYQLKSIGLLDMSNVRWELQDDSSAYIDNTTGIEFMFDSPYYSNADLKRMINFNLTNLGGFKDLGKGYVDQIKTYGIDYKPVLDLQYCSNLTHDSLMNVINTVYDFSNDFSSCTSENDAYGIIQLDVDGVCMARLTDDDIAIANKKGWWVMNYVRFA